MRGGPQLLNLLRDGMRAVQDLKQAADRTEKLVESNWQEWRYCHPLEGHNPSYTPLRLLSVVAVGSCMMHGAFPKQSLLHTTQKLSCARDPYRLASLGHGKRQCPRYTPTLSSYTLYTPTPRRRTLRTVLHNHFLFRSPCFPTDCAKSLDIVCQKAPSCFGIDIAVAVSSHHHARVPSRLNWSSSTCIKLSSTFIKQVPSHRSFPFLPVCTCKTMNARKKDGISNEAFPPPGYHHGKIRFPGPKCTTQCTFAM